MEHINPSTIYWIMQADMLREVLSALAVLFGIAAVIATIIFFATGFAAEERDETDDAWRAHVIFRPWYFVSLVVFFIGLTGVAFFPSTRTLVMMHGLPTAIQVAEDVELDETARKAVAATNKLLDTYLEQEIVDDN